MHVFYNKMKCTFTVDFLIAAPHTPKTPKIGSAIYTNIL